MREQSYDFRFVLMANGIILILGTYLFLSPWVFNPALADTLRNFTLEDYNAWICGCLILAGISIDDFCEWRAWLNFLIGQWAAIAPWVLGFSTNATVRSAQVIVGLAVTGLAAYALCAADRRSRASDEAGDQDGRGGDVRSNVISLARRRDRIAEYPLGRAQRLSSIQAAGRSRRGGARTRDGGQLTLESGDERA